MFVGFTYDSFSINSMHYLFCRANYLCTGILVHVYFDLISLLYVDESGGVGVMAGRDDLGLLAWSQRKMRPLVLVYQYNSPLDIKRMKGDAVMEYKSLVFR